MSWHQILTGLSMVRECRRLSYRLENNEGGRDELKLPAKSIVMVVFD